MPRTLARIALLIALNGALPSCRPVATLGLSEGANPARSEPLPGGLMTETRESGLVVGSLVEQGVYRAADFWPDKDRVDVFRRSLSNRSRSELVVRRLTRNGGDEMEIDLTLEKGEGVAFNHMRRTGSGEVVILANRGNDISSRFDPPALFLPAEVRGGEVGERAFEVRSEGGMFGTGTGRGVSSYKALGRQSVRTPAGDFEAFVLESRLSFSVGPARIELNTRAWLDAGDGSLGVIAEEGREEVRVFGLKVHDVARVSVLTSAGEQRAKAVP